MARNRRMKAPKAGNLSPQQAQRLQRHVQQNLKLAVRHHGAGRLPKAAHLYRDVLTVDPANPTATHLLGVISHQTGDFATAVELISRALELKPDYADAHSNLGNALLELGRPEDALASYYKAVALMPDMAEMHNNVGNALKSLDRIDEALESYSMAVALRPDYADAHFNYGSALQDVGRLQEALTCFQRATALRPDYPEAYDNMGSTLRELGFVDEALACYRQALALRPNDANSQANLAGLCISKLEDDALAIRESAKSLTFLRRSVFGDACKEADVVRLASTGLAFFRLKHDVQQADYLAERGVELPGISEFRDTGRVLLEQYADRADADESTAQRIRPDPQAARTLLPYLQAHHVRDMPEIDGGVLNPDADWSDIEREYLESRNEVIHIDSFLSQPALSAMRDFSLESKVWLKDYSNKYLGAFSDCGFISPIHLQLARELREKLPTVFGLHPLGRSWAFKYDATLGKGINVHADFALVNLNFWTTPDIHNLDQNTGGLIVYDVPSPRSWHFKAYNADKEAIYRFLDEHKANSIRIPHRCNRAILFNSAYFHETDAISFAEGYESRRINITYLFGKR